MSWIINPQGAPARRQPARSATAPETNAVPASPWAEFPNNDLNPRVPDPASLEPERTVSTKQANRPFLAYKAYRTKQEQEHKAWLQRKKEREEKLARGEKVGPEERDPTAEQEVGCLGLLKFTAYLVIFLMLAGKFFTDSFLWEYEGKWARLKTYIPTNQRLFSERLLAQFDGTDPEKPVYLAIDGDVYDVSDNRRTYGPGGPYHFMAGRDAARAFATGCFQTHRTHDTRGLTDSELQGLNHWKQFFADHKTYTKVGRVIHPAIDPSSPIPEHCDPKKAASSSPRKETKENAHVGHRKSGRDEL
ncbi:cytochrome b5 [Gloeophyllum trabeum ATCC 11539]|uniref:Cytochrome b5 n=1 Tax=Gloeophyllum trabeum (strain ATCC 11539 / FP-39264 / Madison 617) TaxID=670483 RepID=S7QIR8_GLOTA|nr:cytochrome b5 [Gloeophyllum trabeum ATCC 11539]EPQ59511.1 cytochrome b5 [Gloeophyllum trabeum ATCC 11539]